MTAVNFSEGTHAYAIPGIGRVWPKICSSLA